MKSIVYVGIDVHKATFSACCYVPAGNCYFAEQTFEGSSQKVVESLGAIAKGLGHEAEFVCGYEAGCRGYSLQKDLASHGINCVIMALTTIEKPGDNGKKKTDRLDARLLARNLANDTFKAVHVTDDEDLRVREYIRLYRFHKWQLKRLKQAIIALCLRFGKVFPGKSYWTAAHVAYLDGLVGSEAFGATLEEYVASYRNTTDRLEKMEARIAEFADLPGYKEITGRIACLKGIAKVTALPFAVEVGDFSRFGKAKVFPSYLGLVPGDHSSGGKTCKTGITKLGNGC